MRSQLLIATLWLLTLILAFLWGRRDSVQEDDHSATTPSESAFDKNTPHLENTSQSATPAPPAEVIYLPAETAPFAHLQVLLGDGESYLESLLRSLSDGELEEFFKQEGGILSEDGEYHYKMLPLLEEWARRDPQAAWEYANRLPSGYPQTEAKETVLVGWARRDLDAAWDAARLKQSALTDQQIRISGLNNRYQQMIAQNLGTEATDEILIKTSSIENPVLRASTYNALISAFLNEQNYDGALELLKKIPDGTVVDDALYHEIPEHWSRHEPANAAEWARKFAEKDTMSQILSNWGSRDARAALEWSIENQQIHKHAIERCITSWATSDLNELAAWLDEKMTAPSRDIPVEFMDSANSAMIDIYVNTNPKDALPYADALSNKDERNQQLKYIYTNWYWRDPISAEAYGLQHGHFNHISEMVINYQLRPGNITSTAPAE